MEWVAIDVNIAGDPGVHRMAETLRVRVPELVGLLALTFAGMAQHAQDGELAGITDGLLEQWARWHGKRGAFAEQFRAELCDARGLVTAWEKYNGAHIRRANAASARTKAWREKQDRERTERELQPSPSANGNAHVTHNSTHNDTHNVCRTRQDKTVSTSTKSIAPDGAAPRPARAPSASWVSEGVALWASIVGAVPPGAFGKTLKPMVDLHGWPRVRPDLEKWLRDRAANGKACNPAWYAGEVTARLAPKPAIRNPDGTLTEYGERITRPDKVPA